MLTSNGCSGVILVNNHLGIFSITNVWNYNYCRGLSYISHQCGDPTKCCKTLSLTYWTRPSNQHHLFLMGQWWLSSVELGIFFWNVMLYKFSCSKIQLSNFDMKIEFHAYSSVYIDMFVWNALSYKCYALCSIINWNNLLAQNSW